MQLPSRRSLLGLSAAAALVATAAAAQASGAVPSPPTAAPAEGAANTCRQDLALWGSLHGAEPLSGTDAGTYTQAGNRVADPSFWLPQQVVTAGETWRFGYEATVDTETADEAPDPGRPEDEAPEVPETPGDAPGDDAPGDDAETPDDDAETPGDDAPGDDAETPDVDTPGDDAETPDDGAAARTGSGGGGHGEHSEHDEDGGVGVEDGAARVRVAVDWYSTPVGDNSGYLGQDAGAWVDVPVGESDPTAVSDVFAVPEGAVRANVISDAEIGDAPNTVSGRACDYREGGGAPPDTDPAVPPPAAPPGDPEPTEPPADPAEPPAEPADPPPAAPAAPSDDGVTAAATHGWGEPIAGGSDEFDYGSAADPVPPDQDKWDLAGGGGGGCEPGHVGNGLRCDEATRVYGDILRMTSDAGGTTGWLGSQFGQQYGRWEVRARSEATGEGAPYHPVLILWPDSGEWPEGGEYDFLENGAPGEDCARAWIHYPHTDPSNIQQEPAEKCGVDLTQWHNFAIEWTADGITGFIDGVEWFSFAGNAGGTRECIQCAEAMHQTIQLDNFGSTQPAVFEIDWARVYEL